MWLSLVKAVGSDRASPPNQSRKKICPNSPVQVRAPPAPLRRRHLSLDALHIPPYHTHPCPQTYLWCV